MAEKTKAVEITSIILIIPVLYRLSGAPSAYSAVLAPVLKWERGGCYASWCEAGWYSSPAAADLDGDGEMEIMASAYSIVVLNTAHSGVVAYDLPGTADARILWRTGRGSYLRNGSPDSGSGPVPCPQCFGPAPVITNITFAAGTRCECRAATSLAIGPGVVVQSGARISFKAPGIGVRSGFQIQEGAVVEMKQP